MTGAEGELTCVVEAEADVDVRVLFRIAMRDCAGEGRVDGEAGHLCGDCRDGFGAVGDYCAPESGVYDERIPQREICMALGGGFRENEAVCTGVDESGTFCILGSVDAFPCGGLFRRVLRCNLMYQRPAVNPFVCGGVCSGGVAVGGGCVGG